MKHRIYVNRHKVLANKKLANFAHERKIVMSEEDFEPCISIKTYKGTKYAREARLGEWTIKQSFLNPICPGATIWIEGKGEVEILA